ncbi:hypothetical protein LT85_0967 [Collimonas arenae]|uniref:SH3b domain-containing protein n=1 Tax=Collimonas arenae TaxID=279058 RepID=A0A0A1F8N1_9BURK|nr:hypothetical protein [Collimonas arenae]AIY40125.1 hypothetical protein LT85_0967 [Collimonas arenae]
MMLAALALVAIVTQDSAALRAAPRESAQQQAVLWQGDSLEVRGEKMDYLQVYDHRRERGGYIRASQVRTQSLEPKDAPDLLAVVRFLRDTPGAEALGISYAAAYLKAAPAEAIGPEPFDALGTMADRLARRASVKRGKTDDTVLSAHLEVASSYGIGMQGFERDGRIQLCYNGEAFRRVLAMKSTDEQRARAALALTRPECVDPNITPTDRNNLDTWRAEILDRVQLTELPEYEKNRLRLRRASVWASIAFEHARQHQPAQEAANRALQELAGVNPEDIAEPDASAYTDAAVRVAASRWAAETEPATGSGLAVISTPGESGETCVALTDAKHDQKNPLAKRCTYGLVWKASASVNAQQTALALAVQPLDSWRELWVFHQGEKGWIVDILPPAANTPDVGYLEFAGWVPGSAKMLAVREARVDGRFKRSFEVIRMDTMDVEKQADNPRSLSLFYRWQDPAWKRGTLSMRR